MSFFGVTPSLIQLAALVRSSLASDSPTGRKKGPIFRVRAPNDVLEMSCCFSLPGLEQRVTAPAYDYAPVVGVGVGFRGVVVGAGVCVGVCCWRPYWRRCWRTVLASILGAVSAGNVSAASVSALGL